MKVPIYLTDNQNEKNNVSSLILNSFPNNPCVVAVIFTTTVPQAACPLSSPEADALGTVCVVCFNSCANCPSVVTEDEPDTVACSLCKLMSKWMGSHSECCVLLHLLPMLSGLRPHNPVFPVVELNSGSAQGAPPCPASCFLRQEDVKAAPQWNCYGRYFLL